MCVACLPCRQSRPGVLLATEADAAKTPLKRRVCPCLPRCRPPLQVSPPPLPVVQPPPGPPSTPMWSSDGTLTLIAPPINCPALPCSGVWVVRCRIAERGADGPGFEKSGFNATVTASRQPRSADIDAAACAKCTCDAQLVVSDAFGRNTTSVGPLATFVVPTQVGACAKTGAAGHPRQHPRCSVRAARRGPTSGRAMPLASIASLLPSMPMLHSNFGRQPGDTPTVGTAPTGLPVCHRDSLRAGGVWRRRRVRAHSGG